MSVQKHKILFLSAWYPNRNDSMFGLFVKRHARAVMLYDKVNVLYVCADQYLKDKLYETEQKNINDNYEILVYYRPFNSKYRILNQIINSYRYLRAFNIGWRILKKYSGKPDIIHVNILTRAAIPAFFIYIFSGIPYVITEHWSRYLPYVNTYKGILRKFFTKKIVSNAKALLVISDNLRQAMFSHNLKNKNTFIINNVVDTDMFKLLPAEKENGAYRLIHISCFEDKSKNISGLLRAIKELTNIRQDFVLHLAGDGQDKDKLEVMAAELGLKDKFVRFDGLLVNNDLAEALGKSHLLVLFSNYENIPVVINEALSCGKPVISTRVGGISEIIDNECGILVEPGDEKNLALSISKMLDNIDIYSPIDLRNKIIGKCSMDNVGKQLSSLYDSIINKKNN